MSNDGEQRRVKQVSARAPGARGAALLPSARAPAIVSARGRNVGELDALLALELILGQKVLGALERRA
jgi:hypothetical protein